jgi:hypothetical protein
MLNPRRQIPYVREMSEEKHHELDGSTVPERRGEKQSVFSKTIPCSMVAEELHLILLQNARPKYLGRDM